MEQARAQYEAVKDAAEKATGKLEESVSAVRSGAMSFNLKALELVRTNTNASFDHLQALFGAKTVQDARPLLGDETGSPPRTACFAIGPCPSVLGKIGS